MTFFKRKKRAPVFFDRRNHCDPEYKKDKNCQHQCHVIFFNPCQEFHPFISKQSSHKGFGGIKKLKVISPSLHHRRNFHIVVLLNGPTKVL